MIRNGARGPRPSWIIPRIESVGKWLDEHEAEHAGLTPLQEEFKKALERAEPGTVLRTPELPWSEGLVRRAFGASCMPGPGDQPGCSHQLALGVASQPWDSCWV
jgi:hypothetical protein